MFPITFIADTVRDIMLAKRQPRPPEVESSPDPDALYRDLIFEVFETGVGITYLAQKANSELTTDPAPWTAGVSPSQRAADDAALDAAFGQG